MKNKGIKNLSEFDLELCKKIKRALKTGKGGQIAAFVVRVAPSGMSRTIRFKFIDNKGNIYHIDHIISQFIGTRTEEGVRVAGCGMDMIFASICNLLSGLGVKDSFKFARYTML